MTIRAWLLSIAAAALLLLGAAALAPHLPALGLAAFVIPFAAVSLSILAAAATVPELAPRALAWLLVPIAALTALALAGSSVANVWGAAAVMALLLGAGTLAGSVLGWRIEAPGHLVVVAIASTFADLYSVFHKSGPSHVALHAPKLLSVLALPWPVLGTRELAPMIGVGDVVFAAIYLAAARKHQLGVARIALALAVAFAAAVALVIGLEAAVPVLPLMGLAVLVAQPKALRVPRRDRVPALVGTLVMGALFAFLFLR